ncbi:uncharacterized protein LOC103856783 isoform X1 [Brassica rapa]|uniref:uncharacterized protein LOC103856783 isoform X1 n=1 Tax=Brassica campestris TaxID=3711 RepID=UPI0004F18F5F|nr:uncharacterized protein LOC103856783 isoform X1 [Brassica rapa]
MADSVVAEVNVRPLKIARYHGGFEGASKSIIKKRDLKSRKLEDDEYLRQYIQFYYQFQKSEGFAVDWDRFDYSFYTKSLDNPPRGFCNRRSAAEIVREVTLLAIERQNEAKGTKLVLAEHIQANYQFASGLMCWLSFWAVDMNSSTVPESKIYQAKIWQRGKEHELHLFRLKPTDEGDSLFVSALLFFWLLSLYSHLNLCVQRLLLLKWSLLLPCYVKTLTKKL